MQAAFVHDHYFVYDPHTRKYYDGSGGVFDEKLWRRYLAVFESLIVIGRQKENLPNKLVDSSCENVTFELRDELKSGISRFTKKKQVKKALSVTLSKVDFAIIRVPSVLGYIAQEICIENNIKYTLEVVACSWDAYWNYGNISGKLMAPLEFYKLKSTVAKANGCIYVTKAFLQSRYPTNCESESISNVNIDGTISKVDKDGFYAQYIKGEEFKIALIGSFHVKYKGHLEVLKALHYLKVTYNLNHFKVYFVGTGDPTWVTDIAKTLGITEFVEIVGTLKAGKEGVLPFIDMMHLYVHPSKQEGLPRVVIEALSRGRLALGSTAAGIPELVDDEFLHEPGDWKKLAKDIKGIYDKQEDWERISDTNLQRSTEYLEHVLQEKRVNYLKRVSNA
ncbi:glycosyltransferase [Sphingobacterium sp. FBM7-1]|uniref:glycosyltransferase n=1 Tax=Sphingobacterium sp. FBM7-1 TaxID=2886688 RepID=UPI001D12FF50|nr:glycosyltransferase [Sphingobacterium sp. FBM7-1]MCC2600006.1 glycosyltransferase family 4 protein [Sphingobacterium sp. FBM7-1]